MVTRAGHLYLFSKKNFPIVFLVYFYTHNSGKNWKKCFFWFYTFLFGLTNSHGPLYKSKKFVLGLMVLKMTSLRSRFQKTHWVLRYWPIYATIPVAKPNLRFLRLFGQYLGTRCVFKTVFCAENVHSSRLFWVPWSP